MKVTILNLTLLLWMQVRPIRGHQSITPILFFLSYNEPQKRGLQSWTYKSVDFLQFSMLSTSKTGGSFYINNS